MEKRGITLSLPDKQDDKDVQPDNKPVTGNSGLNKQNDPIDKMANRVVQKIRRQRKDDNTVTARTDKFN